MNLIPVVELAPTYYQKKHREMPEGKSHNSYEQWNNYWKNCFADSGIFGLDAYEKGSWLVETEKLLNHNYALELMLRKHLTNVDSDSPGEIKEHLSPLLGGYILEITEAVRVFPQCCGSLQDIQQWKSASEHAKSEEAVLWVGHPWLMVSAIDEEHLRLRKTSDYHEPEEPVILELKRSDLKLAVADAEEKLFKFQQALLPLLRKMIRNNAEESLQLLINGYSGRSRSVAP